jgi:MFS family permease
MTSVVSVLVALIAAVSVVQVSNGIVQVLLPIRLAAADTSAIKVGLVASGYSAGVVVGCWAAPRLIRSAGHVAAFLACALISASATALLDVLNSPWTWAGLRLVMGLCYVGMLNVAESWLIVRSPEASRGSIFALYMIACKVTLIGGQMLLAVPELGVSGLTLLAAAGLVLAAAPVWTIRGPTPPRPPARKAAGSPLRFVRNSPVAFLGCLVIGLGNTTVVGIAPAYLSDLGLSTAEVALLMSGIQAGSILSQWPLGRLSDRGDRRGVILLIAAAGAVAALFIALAGAASVPVLLVLFTLWGSAAFSLYAICVAHANDWTPDEQMVSLSSALLLAWATGSAVGPLIASSAMELLGPRALFVYVGATLGMLALFTAWRRRTFPRA